MVKWRKVNVESRIMKAKMERLDLMSKEFLINKIEEMDIEIQKLNGILEMVFKERVINEMKNDFSGYQKSWDIITKIIYIIKTASRPLKSNQILSSLQNLDTNAAYWTNKVSTLSTYLNRALKYKRLISYKVPGTKGYDFYLPEWIDENGNFKVR